MDMTDPRIINIELSGYLEADVTMCDEYCGYRKCEIAQWEDYYDFAEIGEGIVCEDCVDDWVREFIVRKL